MASESWLMPRVGTAQSRCTRVATPIARNCSGPGLIWPQFRDAWVTSQFEPRRLTCMRLAVKVRWQRSCRIRSVPHQGRRLPTATTSGRGGWARESLAPGVKPRSSPGLSPDPAPARPWWRGFRPSYSARTQSRRRIDVQDLYVRADLVGHSLAARGPQVRRFQKVEK